MDVRMHDLTLQSSYRNNAFKMTLKYTENNPIGGKNTIQFWK